MANEIRVRANFVSGTLSGALTNVATSMSSAGLSNLPVIDSTNYAAISIENEIVWVTAHTGGATTATILRGQEGTTGAAHSSTVAWSHGPTAFDLGTDWAPYTPTVKIGATTATIASDSRWSRIGRTIHAEIAFRFVNLNGGTGAITVTRPVVGRTPDVAVRQNYGTIHGVATLFDLSAGAPYKLTFGGNLADQSDFAFHTIAQPGTTATHAAPLAIAAGVLNTGDEIWGKVTYEAAS